MQIIIFFLKKKIGKYQHIPPSTQEGRQDLPEPEALAFIWLPQRAPFRV